MEYKSYDSYINENRSEYDHLHDREGEEHHRRNQHRKQSGRDSPPPKYRRYDADDSGDQDSAG